VGGVGKTSPALQVATAQAAAFADRIAIVSLAHLASSALITTAVAGGENNALARPAAHDVRGGCVITSTPNRSLNPICLNFEVFGIAMPTKHLRPSGEAVA
jgi:hypothetical protein